MGDVEFNRTSPITPQIYNKKNQNPNKKTKTYKKMIELNKIYNADCFDILKQLPDNCIDLILTAPPYQYLKIDFDKEGFDEELFFKECFRVLKKNSFLVFTGLGESYFRWNMICLNNGFKFKESLVWNKIQISSPFNPIKRSHELISIFAKGQKKMNTITIDYIDDRLKSQAYQQIINTAKRINSLLNTNLDLAKKFIENDIVVYNQRHTSRFEVTTSKTQMDADRGINSIKAITKGVYQQSILNISKDNLHHNIHPTQKPVELYSRLIKICSNENEIVLDPFSGSGSSAIACVKNNRNYINIEKNQTYYQKSIDRIYNYTISLF